MTIDTKAIGSERAKLAVDLDSLAPLAASLAGVGYWHYDEVGRAFSWSDEMYRIYGLAPADGPPSLASLVDHCHPDDRERLSSHQNAGELRGKDAEITVRIIRPGGEVRHVVSRSTAMLDESGRMLARFGTLMDITAQKEAEQAANESEARYRFMADYAPDMIARTKAGTGEILYVSPSSHRIFGYTPDEMKSLSPVDMVHPDDSPRIMSSFQQLITERLPRLPQPLRYRARRKDGTWIWIEANPIQIFDDQGQPIEFIDIVRDVTQTKQFEVELEEARRQAVAAAVAKSTFLANMSHELRTPLTSIIGFSRLLMDRGDLPEEATHYAKRISDASEALFAVINDVLDFSKLEAGHVTLESQSFSVKQLVEETTGLIAIQAAAKGVTVKTALDEDTPALITGDMARLRQVLLNFLSNAVKFTDHGSLTVKTRYRRTKTGPRLKLSVIDTGAGIGPDAVKQLFERFSQADVSINRTHGGTGLGLAISKGIIELMGGKVGVRSKLGDGSTFWLDIPAEASVERTAADAGPSPAGCKPMRLLVVDDTAVNRELVKLMLESLGMTIDEASGGAEGVRAAMTTPYDLILMDVRMPDIDGLEATRVIRATSPRNARTPILALTADVQPENAAACRAAGMDDVLSKPIVPEQLVSKIIKWGAAEPEEADAQPRAASA